MNIDQLKTDMQSGVIKINTGEKKKSVYLKDFLKAQVLMLTDFGYSGLTTIKIQEELNKIANSEEVSIIGMFVKDYLDY